MGSSADATIAWGLELAAPEFGGDYDDDAAVAAYETLIEKLEEFQDPDIDRLLGHAGLIETDYYGDSPHDMTGTVLIISRTKTHVNWGCGPIDPATLVPPDEAERAALITVLDHLKFTGDREPKLLLFACYG